MAHFPKRISCSTMPGWGGGREGKMSRRGMVQRDSSVRLLVWTVFLRYLWLGFQIRCDTFKFDAHFCILGKDGRVFFLHTPETGAVSFCALSLCAGCGQIQRFSLTSRSWRILPPSFHVFDHWTDSHFGNSAIVLDNVRDRAIKDFLSTVWWSL
jgi:hypothetical protein